MSVYRRPFRHGDRPLPNRLRDDLKNVEVGIRCYHRDHRDNPRLLQGLEARKRELEAALRRVPKDR